MSELGARIVEGLEDALEFAQGETEGRVAHQVHVPEQVDVKDIRTKLSMTQKEFAERFGFTVFSVRNWEQGRRQPEGPARILLTIIDREPQAALRALTA